MSLVPIRSAPPLHRSYRLVWLEQETTKVLWPPSEAAAFRAFSRLAPARAGHGRMADSRSFDLAASIVPSLSPLEPLETRYDRAAVEDVGYLTCMTLVLLGNYAQTGHF